MHVIVYFGVWKCHVCTSHLCNWMFTPYYTHLVYVKRLCCLGSTQTIYRNELYALHCTHLDLVEPFLLRCLIENSSPEWTVCHISHTPWSSWLFLLCCLITNSSFKWTVCCVSHTPSSGCPFLLFLLIANGSLNWTVCPASHAQLKSGPCLMHPSSQTFYTFLTVFIHHRLRLWHHTQFLEGSLIIVSH